MDLSQLINVCLCILSFLLSAISVVTVVITLRQNNKMIESSTRPYICIYGDSLNFQNPTYYLILKNFGQSGAVITDFKFSPMNSFEESNKLDREPFTHIVGTYFAPSQSIRYPMNFKEVYSMTHQIEFEIDYMSGEKSYKEKVVVNLDARIDTYSLKASTKNEELKIISNTLQELVERSL